MTSYQVRTEEPTLELSDKDSVTWKSQNGASYHLNNETGEIETNSSKYESDHKNPTKTNRECATNGITGLNHLETSVKGVISDKGSSEEDIGTSEIEVEILLGPYPESLQDELMLKPPKPCLQVESSNSSVAKKESGLYQTRTEVLNNETNPYLLDMIMQKGGMPALYLSALWRQSVAAATSSLEANIAYALVSQRRGVEPSASDWELASHAASYIRLAAKGKYKPVAKKKLPVPVSIPGKVYE
ncbi:hypothetical protein BS47DRAFT_1389702 [Hydnum rufescens UP504]|uniref:Uncharacterized protein n=1 Tax=Hydnum rufescens UP504 TaxID=1448309 RepID=A0A9P6B5F2_9AGAM|nr:hypothetical protein BS47DRAFT_1389702 [Hydnum rufescens UP504]